MARPRKASRPQEAEGCSDGDGGGGGGWHHQLSIAKNYSCKLVSDIEIVKWEKK